LLLPFFEKKSNNPGWKIRIRKKQSNSAWVLIFWGKSRITLVETIELEKKQSNSSLLIFFEKGQTTRVETK